MYNTSTYPVCQRVFGARQLCNYVLTYVLPHEKGYKVMETVFFTLLVRTLNLSLDFSRRDST